MNRSLPLLVLAAAAARAQDHAHHHPTVPLATDAQIVVMINPEARVSAVRGAPLLAQSACGQPVELKVNVLNQGFVTAPLRATLVGDSARHVDIRMDGTKLSGASEERRTLLLIPRAEELVDVTIAFRIDHNIGALGGRERVHLLLRCNTSSEKDGGASRSNEENAR